MAKFIDFIVLILDQRVSVTQLAKAEDLVLSNASLKDIKKGINKIYTQINTSDRIN
ncbi:hypothetical protein [Lysinibacillus sp. NPDC047702]|uniref:hypothetical protein n=1 Tax=unclassified Lysinibacillus TaxID=2636778 RepID=UPI003D007D13